MANFDSRELKKGRQIVETRLESYLEFADNPEAEMAGNFVFHSNCKAGVNATFH